MTHVRDRIENRGDTYPIISSLERRIGMGDVSQTMCVGVGGKSLGHIVGGLSRKVSIDDVIPRCTTAATGCGSVTTARGRRHADTARAVTAYIENTTTTATPADQSG